MKISEEKMIYFSPTGSTKQIADILGDAGRGKVKKIDITIEKRSGNYKKEQLVWFLVPSYGGRVPSAALERIKEFRGDGTPAVLVVTYGNRAYDDTLLELEKQVRENGFVTIAAAAAVTEHSIMHQFGTGRPSTRDRKELREFAGKIRAKAAKLQEPSEIEVPGKEPYRRYEGVPLKPKAGKKCISCGICAKRCPVQAIPVDEPKRTEKDKCISCMRCIKVCPNKARSLNPALLKIAGFKMKKVCEKRKENELFLD